MMFRASQILRLPAALLSVAALPLTASSASAQRPVPLQPSQFDPSDVYFQGYLAARAAEQLEKDGHFTEAQEKLHQAQKLFGSVQTYYPDWKPRMVQGRMAQTQESLAKVEPKANAQRQQERGAIAELEGGARTSGIDLGPAPETALQAPGVLEKDPLAARRLAQAESEIERLRSQLEASQITDTEASRNLSRLRDVERQRNALQAQLRTAESNAEALRSKLAAAPAEQAYGELNQRIESLEQERQALSQALGQSRNEHLKAQSRIATLEADLQAMRQKAADLERDLKTQQETANEVVAGQRRQLEELQKKLAERDAELTQANERIASLQQQLTETRESFDQLLTEHDSLLQEHDQLSALLQLDQEGRIQQLVEQNMGLAKQLREATERVEAMQQEGDQTQDDYTDALRDLAIAKTQINKLHQEKRAQDQRLAELEKRLKNEERALTHGESAADPAELEVLRDVVKRQLRSQERRRQARELLVEAVKELGTEDEKLSQAIALFDGEEIELTPQESRLIADKQVDGEFVSPFARDKATVDRATATLNRDLDSYDRAATKAFLAGRLLPTRELYQLMIEANPGHIPALCKLGVVHLRLEDYLSAAETFQRAVELDPNHPYAHRMLGFAHMASGDLLAAETHVRQAVELSPDDSKSHTLLAAISYRLGNMKEAESHYKAAITVDPMPSEPYYNLALLCLRESRFHDARDYYDQALQRGAVPDPKLEQRLQN